MAILCCMYTSTVISLVQRNLGVVETGIPRLLGWSVEVCRSFSKIKRPDRFLHASHSGLSRNDVVVFNISLFFSRRHLDWSPRLRGGTERSVEALYFIACHNRFLDFTSLCYPYDGARRNDISILLLSLFFSRRHCGLDPQSRIARNPVPPPNWNSGYEYLVADWVSELS